MSATEILVAVLIAVGVAGIIVPVLPGTVLVLGAILVWALEIGTSVAWLVFAFATTFLVLGTDREVPRARPAAEGVRGAHPHPGRREASSPSSASSSCPVVGMFIGFVLGVYVAERARVGAAGAWPSTKAALRAVGVSILIELVAAFLAVATWVIGVVVT